LTDWKKPLFIGIGWGLGMGVGLAIIVGGFLWYKSRPKPPKPWNATALTATFDKVDNTGDDQHILFYYVLENRTNADYRVDEKNGIELTAKLKEEKSIMTMGSEFQKISLPIFVPANQRLRVQIEIPYSYRMTQPPFSAKEDRKKFQDDLQEYVRTEIGNLDGFVLFDSKERYQISFPRGW
jgi:hypothetical protein